MKLVKGKGSPETGACWMSAIAHYVGEKSWTDAPECVAPELRSLCANYNDLLGSDEDREAKISPVIFDVAGTRTEDQSVINERLRIAAGFAVRCAKLVLNTECKLSVKTLEAAEAWLRDPSEHFTYSPTCATDSAGYSVKAASRAIAYAASSAACVADANNAGEDAAYAAHAAIVVSTSLKSQILDDMLSTILAMAAIGTRKELPEVRPLCTIPAYKGLPLDSFPKAYVKAKSVTQEALV